MPRRDCRQSRPSTGPRSRSTPARDRDPLAARRTGLGAINGCCAPNIHSNVRVGAGTRMATPEAFAIDWMRIDGDEFFTGDGKPNEHYPISVAAVTAVGDGAVVALHDGMAESTPFAPLTTVHEPDDYGGNHVVLQDRARRLRLLRPSPAGQPYRQGRGRVAAGAVIGKLGNSGNSTTRTSISAWSTAPTSSPATASPS